MALTDGDVSMMTMGELERIAQRLAAAAAAIREAREMLGMSVARPSPGHARVTAPLAPMQAGTLSAEQQKALDEWRASPARKKLLGQLEPLASAAEAVAP